MSISGSTRIVDDKLRAWMESAVTVREILEKETLDEAKMKRNLSSAKKYKALAWEQLAAYELAHRTQTAEETRLLSSLEEKTTFISSLRKTYADKREQAVGHVVSTLLDKRDSCEDFDFEEAYVKKANWFDFLVKNPDEWDDEAAKKWIRWIRP